MGLQKFDFRPILAQRLPVRILSRKVAIDIGLAEGVGVNIVANERAPNIDALLSRSAAW